MAIFLQGLASFLGLWITDLAVMHRNPYETLRFCFKVCTEKIYVNYLYFLLFHFSFFPFSRKKNSSLLISHLVFSGIIFFFSNIFVHYWSLKCERVFITVVLFKFSLETCLHFFFKWGSFSSTWLILLYFISYYFIDLLLFCLGFFPYLLALIGISCLLGSMHSVSEFHDRADALELRHLGLWYIPKGTRKQVYFWRVS